MKLDNFTHTNNTVLLLESIGEREEEALICRTDLTGCCSNLSLGHWFYPNRSEVPASDSGNSIYRDRGDAGQVFLRRHNVLSPLGTYCCEVPTTGSGGSNGVICVFLSKLILSSAQWLKSIVLI